MAGSAGARWPGALALAAVLAAGAPAGLTQPGPGRLLGGPAEGDIQLKDGAGHWMLMRGIPVDHAGIDGRSTRVAVIDSGVAADHPQLAGLVSVAKDFTGEGAEDKVGHGTVMAITLRAAGASMGMAAPSPEIVSAKVAGADGTIRKQAVIAAI